MNQIKEVAPTCAANFLNLWQVYQRARFIDQDTEVKIDEVKKNIMFYGTEFANEIPALADSSCLPDECMRYFNMIRKTLEEYMPGDDLSHLGQGWLLDGLEKARNGTICAP